MRFCILLYRGCACLLYLTDGTFTRFEQIKDISRPIMFYAKSGAESFWYTYIRAARQRSEIRNRAPRAQKKPVGRFKRQVVSGALCRSTVYREGTELLVRFCILLYRGCACLLYLTDGTLTRFEQIKDILRPIIFMRKAARKVFGMHISERRDSVQKSGQTSKKYGNSILVFCAVFISRKTRRC